MQCSENSNNQGEARADPLWEFSSHRLKQANDYKELKFLTLMLEALKHILDRAKGNGEKGLPRHIAFVTKGKHAFASNRSLPLEGAYALSCRKIDEIVSWCISKNIPAMTFYLLSTKRDNIDFGIIIDAFSSYLEALASDEKITGQKVKVTVIGRWYDLPERLVNAIKGIIEKTKDNDKFFLNFCLNYNGHDEIVDSVNLIVKQIQSGKAVAVTRELIKENSYSSYFPPPDLFVINGSGTISDLLLWDAPDAKVFFSGKLWPEFELHDLRRAVEGFQK